jgi:hypothetical protein
LEKQAHVLDELRSRTGLLLAASSLATSFLGRAGLDDAESLLLALALVAFTASIGACVFILVPRSDGFTFSLVGSAVFEQLYDERDDMDEIYRRLAYDLDRFWDENDAAIQPLFRAFTIAAIAFAAEILLLFAAFGDTLL